MENRNGKNKYTTTSFVSDTHAKCSNCQEIKEHSAFYKDKKNIYRKTISYFCKECTKAKTRAYHNARIKSDPVYKESKKNQYILTEYGITLDQYRQKLAEQGSKCAICSVPIEIHTKYAHLDHDHSTGKLRDFLCGNCNRGIGSFHDEVWKMKKAIEYIERHKECCA